MVVAIADIKIKKRVRQDLGDIEGLMKSLDLYGLLNPVIINTKNELIAGHRRLEAAKRLGWQNIRVIQIDITDKLSLLELEMEENIQRLDFTEDELRDGLAKLDKLRNPNIFKRLWQNIADFFSDIFSSNAKERLDAKVDRARKYLLLFPVGILMLILSSIWSKSSMQTDSVFKTVFDISTLLVLLGARLSLVRLIYLRRNSEK